MGEDLLAKAFVVIAASVGAAAIFARLRSPPAVGYLVAGVLIGPHGLGLLQLESETEFLAELGVIFLMFMVGLEFSLSAMFKARDDVFIAGGLNVAVVGGAGALCAFALGASPLASILLGAALAMSSTAMTVKALADRGEISTTFGRYALAILIFQDLAALPFLVAADGDASAAADPQRLIAPLFIALTFVIAAMLFWKPIFGAILSSVARTRHADFFLLTVLLVAIGAAGAADLAGLAPTIGAFLAGMVIGESDFRHRVMTIATLRPDSWPKATTMGFAHEGLRSR